ncbi:MAG: YraN family protein [Desulfobacterales bacterium]|nr:YraN family protein [Desulfobacterales bacterium]
MSFFGKRLGRKGEADAHKFLRSKGFAIVETNYATRNFEIDIIAHDKDTLCFLEVKARTGVKKGLPREAVSSAKQKKIIMGATYYLKKMKVVNQRVRFDVVELIYNEDTSFPPEITLIKNAFSGA